MVTGARRRRPALDRPARVALLLGVAGVGYRLALLLLDVPGSNSDEGTFGLVALHIAQGRAHPVFLYGQRYMGVLESYLAAPLFVVAGPSWLALRLPLLVLYALFVYLMYRLTRRIGSPWFAALVVGLLALGPERVVRDQLTAVGGRPEAKVAVAAMLLVAVGLAEGTLRRRRLAGVAFGALAGVAVWSDWLIVPYLAAAGLVLVFALRRELLGRAVALPLAGFAVGAAPMIYDNLTVPAGQRSWEVFQQVNAGDGGPVPALGERLRGGFAEGVPLAAGLCPPGGCAGWQAWFGLLYPLLLALAAGFAVVTLRRRVAHPVRPVTHLALVGAAALTLLGYVRSPLAASDPLASARYLAVLQLSLPAVLWPLWAAAVTGLTGRAARFGRGSRSEPTGRGSRGSRGEPAGPGGRVGGAVGTAGGRVRAVGGAVAVGALAALVGVALVATGLFVTDAAGIRAEERQARRLAETLRADGPRHVYGDYWTCGRLVFHTAEEVVCAVVDDRLGPGQNRYPAYWRAVGRAERPGYVLRPGSAAERRLTGLLAERNVPATVTDLGGYRLYRPASAVRP
ncbi:hypothetical protein O7606_09705 [Micromonospora sp. WMMD882]|uniref:ArnT family glycosyltransferase n=1 Tax=Micromonospora sp. WMMD882 TaxID=3015151 RepID=UPI00248C3004|nr:hypothetical protein [Micromonospora sp. WMMD882]WBB81608.1 hypothetical protein O7606_09705 [Micromonospora sp. WMMD882]